MCVCVSVCARVCVRACVCVRMRARACVRAFVRACVREDCLRVCLTCVNSINGYNKSGKVVTKHLVPCVRILAWWRLSCNCKHTAFTSPSTTSAAHAPCRPSLITCARWAGLMNDDSQCSNDYINGHMFYVGY